MSMPVATDDASEQTGLPRTIRVVLSDRHAMVRAGIRRLLEAEEDLDVVGEAGDLDETVHLASYVRPDILVLDLATTLSSPVHVIERLDMTLPPEQRVLLTNDDEETRGYPEAKAPFTLSKTGSVQDLIAAIRAVHHGRSLRRLPLSLVAPYAAEWMKDAPTRRELDVLRLVAEGKSNREIAGSLSIAERTVEFHLGHAFEKLGARSRTQAVHVARKRGWID